MQQKEHLSDIIETLGEDERSHLLSMACKIPCLQYGTLQAFTSTFGETAKRQGTVEKGTEKLL